MPLYDLLSRLEKSSSWTAVIKTMQGGVRELCISGLWGASRSCLVASLRRWSFLPALFITPTGEEAEKIEEDLRSLCTDAVHLFPAWETLPGEDLAPHPDIVADRLMVLAKLLGSHGLSTVDQGLIVVAPFSALLNRVISPSALSSCLLRLSPGQTVDREKLVRQLVAYGYEHAAMVGERGDFSRRGGILDIYPSTGEHPLRLEFFADTIESMRSFSVINQRSLGKVGQVAILPRSELTVRPKGQDLTTLLSYFPRQSLIFLDEPARLRAINHQPPAISSQPPITNAKQAPARLVSFSQILAACREKRLIYTSLLPQTVPGMQAVPSRHFPMQSLDQGQLSELSGRIKAWRDSGYRIIFICHNEGEKRRLKELLPERNIRIRGKLSIGIGRLQSGFLFPEIKLVLLTDAELFARYRLRRPRRRFKGGVPLADFLDLQEGDYLVHINQGIGKYLGVERLLTDGRERDFLALEYLNKDKLYLPVEELHLVQKYVGVEGRAPLLSRLGGRSWERIKKKVKKSIQDLAGGLLELQAAREARRGFAFSPDTPWQHEFEAAFIYEETPDQLRTLEAVKQDMESSKPMDRLICGDVGYGKTEVAVRAAFKCVMEGQQVAVLVPTTILAQQHRTTFSDRVADYPLNIAMLSRFKTRSQQREIVEGLEKGTVDIVIGTHRLLQEDIAFKNLGLVIIDEEQRFGVAHKEKLKKLRKLVDVLTLTATPIPRTLHMSLMGLKDMSRIDTPPEDRLPIQTFVAEYDQRTITEAIRREISRNGQVFFVHNRVQGIERVAEKLRRLVPEARIAIAHGQLRERELEKVMSDFLNHKIDVLVATTIIESGLDIPNANTIIINRADAFGLSDLYQLRGRVGRFKHLAFAYLLFPKYLALSEVSQKRLRAMEEFSDLGSGFRIAMRDLQLRGAGNLLGPEQHGYIVEVGFDLYCRLLRETVRELKGEKGERKVETYIDLGLDASIPDDYIPDVRQRLSIYRKMAEITHEAALKDLQEELNDRFGPLPPSIKQLLSLVALRLEAAQRGLTYLGLKGTRLIAKFRNKETLAFLLHPEEKENLIQTLKNFLFTIKPPLSL